MLAPATRRKHLAYANDRLDHCRRPALLLLLAALALLSLRGHLRHLTPPLAPAAAFPLSCGVALATVVRTQGKRKAKAEEGPSESALLVTTLSAVREPVIVTDREQRVVLINSAAEKLVGLSAREAVGRKCCVMLAPGGRTCLDRCPALAAIDLVQRHEAAPVDVLSGQQRDRTPVAIVASPVVEPSGTVSGAVLVLSAIPLAKEWVGERSAFTSMVSHEMSARLASISASAEFLMGAEADCEQRQELIEGIRSQSARLAGFFESLLNAERLQAGRVAALCEPLAILPVIKRVVAGMAAIGRGHRFKVVAADRLPLACGDEDKTEAVLFNLVENATKYSATDSDIRISAGVASLGEIVVAVQDQGVGIPPEEIGVIFERFHRVYRSGGLQAHGHGLGLYIARGFVEAQGGRLWAESQVGRGSTFYFTLPRLEDDLLT